MGQPLVKRLTVRSGLHPDSAAPAHLAILHVGPSVPVPAKADDGRGRSAGRAQPINAQMGCEHHEHAIQHSLWHDLLCKLRMMPLVSSYRTMSLPGPAR